MRRKVTKVLDHSVLRLSRLEAEGEMSRICKPALRQLLEGLEIKPDRVYVLSLTLEEVEWEGKG